MRKVIILLISLLVFCCNTEDVFAFSLLSADFAHHKRISKIFTCHDKNISPALHWNKIPPNTQTLALIMSDLDAASGEWIHWILYNIPATVTSLPRDIQIFPSGTQLGKNSWGNSRYEGPCPPKGMHRYNFILYALDERLNLPDGATKTELEKAMQQHVIDTAELRIHCGHKVPH